jgi:hypothetical protein
VRFPLWPALLPLFDEPNACSLSGAEGRFLTACFPLWPVVCSSTPLSGTSATYAASSLTAITTATTLNINGSANGVNGIKSVIINGTPVALGVSNAFTRVVFKLHLQQDLRKRIPGPCGLFAYGSENLRPVRRAPCRTGQPGGQLA